MPPPHETSGRRKHPVAKLAKSFDQEQKRSGSRQRLSPRPILSISPDKTLACHPLAEISRALIQLRRLVCQVGNATDDHMDHPFAIF